jgi:glycosyltransferase involved in cell wall biosynthesis
MSHLVSIVINNFNYARYLPAAIDSALGQDHAPLEVVVVDDGSTDESREVITAYGDRVRPVFKQNGGAASALNAGFAASAGDIVMFLDADDYLNPSAASKVLQACTDTCAKVQYRLSIVDKDGNHRGVDPPLDTPMPNGDVVPQLLRTGRYTTPVTTGNAYRRSVLDQVMPIPEAEFTLSADAFLNLVSPFYGVVVSLDEELGNYRLHGANRWAFSGGVTAAGLRSRVQHDLVRERFLKETAETHGHAVPPDLSLNDWHHVLHRLSLLRLDRPQHPVPSDSRIKLVRAGLAAIKHGSGLSALERAFYGAFLVAMGILPRRLAAPLVGWVLASRPKPRWVRFLLRTARQSLSALQRLRGGRSAG